MYGVALPHGTRWILRRTPRTWRRLPSTMNSASGQISESCASTIADHSSRRLAFTSPSVSSYGLITVSGKSTPCLALRNAQSSQNSSAYLWLSRTNCDRNRSRAAQLRWP